MAKIVCLPKVSAYHAARDRSFYVDLSQVKGHPFFIPIFTLSHDAYGYEGRLNNLFHYSTFHIIYENQNKKFYPNIRQTIINGGNLSDKDLQKIDNNHAQNFSGRSYHDNVFFISNSSDLEEAISLMQETIPLENHEQLRQTILRYVTPFLDFSLKSLDLPRILL